jgi:capsular exopolysaccharide synthesis family protein
MAEHEELVPTERRLPERVHRRADSIIDSGTEGTEGYSYIRAYLLILLKHFWTILTVMLLLATVVAIVSFKTQPVYEATARVEVEADTPQIQSLEDLFRGQPGFSDETFLETQINVLKSENLAWRTIQQLGLGENVEFAPASGGGERGPGASLTAAENRLIRAFRKHLRVQLMRGSRMVEVTFESHDPQLAARVANALVNNYTEYNFHQKYDATREASGFMEQQLDELKAKVEKSQQAMVDYERRNLIVDIGDKQSVVEQRLAAMSTDLTTAQSDRMQKQSLYELVSSNDPEAALATQDGLLQSLDEKYASLREDYVDAVGQYGPNFPKVKRLQDQLNEVQSMMQRERKRLVTRLRSDYVAALGRERLLGAAVAHEKEEVGKLNQLSIEHNLLKREFETNQQLYASLLQHLKDATVSAGLRATNIHVVDSASAPTVPVRPRIMYNIAISIAVGLVLGMTLAFVMESMDTSIKSAEDLERIIGAPALAVVPMARSPWLRRGPYRSQPQDGTVESIVLKHPTSSLAESYHILRTAILLSTAPRPPQALLVTSAQPGEGKTCTALNLAMGLAQRGVPVALVDADMRRPGVARALALSANGVGLSTILSGAHSLDEALHQFEPLPNLWVLPAGPEAPNPADLLSSPTMQKILQELRGRFGHVVVDSAPLLMVTDATILSGMVDGVVLVVESGVMARRGLVRAHKILESGGGRILGGVLNKWDARSEGYYAYYGSYYRGYYRSHYGGYSHRYGGNSKS